MARKKAEPKITYNSQQEAAIAKEQLQQLLQHPAWRRLQLFYKKKIAFHQDELNNKKIDSLDELQRIRDKINLCTQSMNLPEIMIGQIEINVDEEKITFDPFA